MLINGIDFEVIINVKKIKKIYFRVRVENNINYLIINSYKKLTLKEIKKIIDKNTSKFDQLIKTLKNNPIKKDEILILGQLHSITLSEIKIKQAYNKIEELFDYYKKIFNKQTTILKFRKMKTRWGVCHITKNYINLTTHLIHIPIHLIEYVIIHEFCHFKHCNHSQSFYNEVKKYCPDYKKRVKEMKEYSFVLV